MPDSYQRVFHGDGWVAKPEATVPVASLAMRYGLSVFEGVRLYRQAGRTQVQPFLLGAHVDRLRASLAMMRIEDPGVDRLPELVDELVARNGIDDDAYVRIAVSAGNPGTIAEPVQPLLTVSATPMGRKRWLRTDEGMRLRISDWQRAPEASFPAAAKNISNYAGPRLAVLEAKDAGFDGCVLTNQHGRLCEAPTAALFLLTDGVLRTPALTEGVLPGITRRWVLDTAAEVGLAVEETTLERVDAYRADEAFLCGTGIEFAFVRGFDEHACKGWPRASATRALVQRYFSDARTAAMVGAA
ncbi:Branched-chain amino acid aminotransferase [Alloactinosynnema sp. L-07]|uniref:aminotransferase class IV n=1 Tax=Alloactinosynnema sp. L-07 TaxID=1653480 RepID=UPI00065F0A8E|nr:aminotransferase class IV [Alloactinosynnema sp. L-07]CRK57281.1 Branched-chain amino acid aminotransferase [Alloactinosynnema sp. L-07]